MKQLLHGPYSSTQESPHHHCLFLETTNSNVEVLCILEGGPCGQLLHHDVMCCSPHMETVTISFKLLQWFWKVGTSFGVHRTSGRRMKISSEGTEFWDRWSLPSPAITIGLSWMPASRRYSLTHNWICDCNYCSPNRFRMLWQKLCSTCIMPVLD